MAAIDNVNSLRIQTVPANNTTVEVKGYYTGGDGGGGIFYWDTASATFADNGWDVIQINNNNTGKWRRLIDDRFMLNIRWFGPKALTTAGALETTVNDTDFINRAISALSVWFHFHVYVATTGPISSPPSGLPTIDGVPLPAGKLVLVKDQANKSENGIYLTNSTTQWERAGDYDTVYRMMHTVVPVEPEGIINGGKLFQCTITNLSNPNIEFTLVPGSLTLNTLGKGGTLLFPKGKYQITSTIKIAENVLLKGLDFLPVNAPILNDEFGEGTDNIDPYCKLLQKKVALFSVEITTNKETTPAFVCKPNTGISGFTFYYPLQKQTLAIGEAPEIYDYTISTESYLNNPNRTFNDNLFFENLFLINPYRAFNLIDAGRFNIRNIYGQPIETGIVIHRLYDMARAQNIHFWTFHTSKGSLFEWIKTNGTAFKLGKIDGISAVDWFAFGYGKGFYFFDSNYYAASFSSFVYSAANFKNGAVLSFALQDSAIDRAIRKDMPVVVRKATSHESLTSISLHTLSNSSSFTINISLPHNLTNLVGITVFVELATNPDLGFTAVVASHTSSSMVVQNLTEINGSGTFTNWIIRENKTFQASVIEDYMPSADAILKISNLNNIIGTGNETINNWEITIIPGACWGTFTACNIDHGTEPIVVEKINNTEFLGGTFISNKFEKPIITTGKSVTVEPSLASKNENVIKFIGANFYGSQSVDVVISSIDSRFVFDSCFFKDGRSYPANGYNFAPLISTSSAIVSISNCTGFETIVPFGANGVSLDGSSLFRKDFDVTPTNFGMNAWTGIPPTGDKPDVWLLGSPSTASWISQLSNTVNGNGIKITLSTQTDAFVFGMVYPLVNTNNLVQENGLYVVEFDYQTIIPKTIDSTSTSSITVSAFITITIGVNLKLAANEPVTCLKVSDSTKKVVGIVSNYTAATGVLIIANPVATFTGTVAGNWTVSIEKSGGLYTNFKVARDIGNEISVNYGNIGALVTNGNVYKIRLPIFLGAASPFPLAFFIGWTTFGNIVGEINITNLKIYKQDRKFTTNDQASGMLKRIYQDPLGNGITHSVAGGKVINYGLSIPNQAPSHTGAWKIGDIVYAVGPAAGSYIGWVCTGVGATPTFKTFGAISV